MPFYPKSSITDLKEAFDITLVKRSYAGMFGAASELFRTLVKKATEDKIDPFEDHSYEIQYVEVIINWDELSVEFSDIVYTINVEIDSHEINVSWMEEGEIYSMTKQFKKPLKVSSTIDGYFGTGA